MMAGQILSRFSKLTPTKRYCQHTPKRTNLMRREHCCTVVIEVHFGSRPWKPSAASPSLLSCPNSVQHGRIAMKWLARPFASHPLPWSKGPWTSSKWIQGKAPSLLVQSPIRKSDLNHSDLQTPLGRFRLGTARQKSHVRKPPPQDSFLADARSLREKP